MCGFFFYNSKNLIKRSKPEILAIKDNLRERGPDNFNYIQKKKFSMFFSRLSIIDQNKRSNQPFTDNKKEYFMVFNGEIYNFIELKKKLINEGIFFNTKSDTEVLFKLIMHKGIKETLRVIQGMFSFVFYDVKKKKIYGARDHFGQKPFYFHKSNNKFLASTNIRPILENIKNKNLNLASLKQYLCSSGIIPAKNTFFSGISTLPAGSYITIYGDKCVIKKYFKPIDMFHKKKYSKFKDMNEETVIKILDHKMKKAVERHLISDTKVGVTCSGGIDSALILKYANEIDKEILTLTNTSKGIERLSEIVPKILKKNNISKKRSYFIKQNKNNYISTLSKLIHNNLFPARWGGGPPMKNLCAYAKKKNISVILGGDGIDEYFCGYNSFYHSLYNNNKYGLHNILLLNKKFGIKKNIINEFYNKITNSKKKISKKVAFIKDKKERKIITNSFLDTEFFLQSCTLPHADEYSMNSSVEMRNPYLDLELVEFCLNLPGKFKISKQSNFKNKLVVRKLAIKKYGKFIDKEKEGTRNYSKYISNKRFWNFNKFQILKTITMKKNLHYKEIFKLINLEILLRATLTNNFNYLKDIVTNKGSKEFKIN
jgi:asparagine synthase (glutamine-hydrolysing)